MHCTAFLGMSLDGFIAGPNGELDWLDHVPAPPGNDMGYGALIESVDAIVMGSVTFDVVAGFGGDWPYTVPVIVMSKSMTELPAEVGDVELTSLEPAELIEELASRGMTHLYIDGGAVVRSFLEAELLDELITTVLPVVLGNGIQVFGGVRETAWFEHVSSEVFDNGFVQSRYVTANAWSASTHSANNETNASPS